ncbi:MAG: oxidoreductase domain protein, partial [Bacteroidetes bacterium]|nr:oxidoreductase domain protein [Bacteroidota bacterium]
LKLYLKEPDAQEKLEMGWTIKYITDLAIPVDFYLRGEEYSAQIDNFVHHVMEKKPTAVNTFRQALETDRVMEIIMAESKR